MFRQKSSPRRTPEAVDAETGDGARLQKVMAAAGVGSRRHCEELILAGRVEVDGKTVRKLGTKVDTATQQVRVDGEVLKSAREPVYYFVNKPVGIVCTNYDPAGRPRVVDLVPQQHDEHLYTVGRLDLSSEGLILVTNDGELANRLTHPRFGIEKTYLALVAGQMPQAEIDKLRTGVHLAEGVARCVSVHVRKALPQSTLLEIVLAEGKNREIRRILAKVGHKVLTLKRTAIGPVKLRDLKPGEFRRPTRDELKTLREAKPAKRKPPQRRPSAAAAPPEETTTEVVPIVDTRNRPTRDEYKPKKNKRFERRGKRREPGTGTIIGED
jgi:23S rRNA pseudouridine2605 synthase